MEKIINFEHISQYWCTKCTSYHSKKRSGKLCKPFELHKEFAFKLSDIEARNIAFKRLWKRQGNTPKKYSKPAYLIN